MSVILVFVGFAVVGIGLSMGVASFFERYSSHVNLLVFLGLFMGQFVISWILALKFTERYLQPKS